MHGPKHCPSYWAVHLLLVHETLYTKFWTQNCLDSQMNECCQLYWWCHINTQSQLQMYIMSSDWTYLPVNTLTSYSVKFLKIHVEMEWVDLWQFTFTFTYPIVMDRRGITGVLATNSLHSSWLSVFLKVSLSSNPVHSFILSSHLFCLPLFLPPGTVPCGMVWSLPAL